MKLFPILFLLTSAGTLACDVKLPSQMLVLDEGPLPQEIKIENCPETLYHDLRVLFTEVEGRISSFQLTEILSQKGHKISSIHPHMIHVLQMRALVRGQLRLPQGVLVAATRPQNTAGIIPLSDGDRIEVLCPNCLFGSRQPLEILVSEFSGANRRLHASADFKKMVKAYRVVSAINPFSSIEEKSSLREEYVEAVPHTEFLDDATILRFYQSNKPIRPGELLKKADLNAINIVRAGLRTEVILENEMVKIKTHGISRSSGAIGDTVEVFHQQKNKKYQGKVVDINKVLVEL